MKILYTSDQVTQRVKGMAQEIINTYPTDKPLFVCLLKGAVPFASQLLTAITEINPAFYPEVEYMHVSAYGDKREASDATTYSSIAENVVRGRDVIVLDDCLDRGFTYQDAKRQLLDQGAVSVRLVVLAHKQTGEPGHETPLLVGFDTPDVWLVGMGMDDAAHAPEAERWAGYIGHVSPEQS